MGSVLLIGRNRTLLGMLSNVLAARGCAVDMASSQEEMPRALTREVDLAVYDHDRAQDFDLNPRHFGYDGQILFLCDSLAAKERMAPFCDAVLLKPIDLETLVCQTLQQLRVPENGARYD